MYHRGPQGAAVAQLRDGLICAPLPCLDRFVVTMAPLSQGTLRDVTGSHPQLDGTRYIYQDQRKSHVTK
jgi:hypothetical protein